MYQFPVISLTIETLFSDSSMVNSRILFCRGTLGQCSAIMSEYFRDSERLDI